MSTTTGGSASLVSVDALAEALAVGAVSLVEVSHDPDAVTYRAGHIPGATHAPWKKLLWHECRRAFVSGDVLRERLARIGIPDERPLVVYGDPVQYGTYAYWVMTNAGVGDVRLLDGTATTWQQSGRELVSSDSPPVALQALARRGSSSTPAEHTRDSAFTVGWREVLEVLDAGGTQILDVRSPEEYSGERVSPPSLGFDHGAERGGHIPGALHLPYESLLRDDDRFRSAEELAGIVARACVDTSAPTIVYCRLSHRASLAWFALTRVLGMPQVRVYDGSWTEWGSMVGMPIECGTGTV